MIIALILIFLFPVQASSIELKLGVQDTQPKYILKDGKLSGICFDILEKAKTYLTSGSINFIYSSNYIPLKRIFRRVEDGTYHMYCGAGFNKQRAEKLRYSEIPLYDVKNLIVGRSDSRFVINGIEDLVANKSRVLFMRGTSTEKFLRRNNLNFVPISPNNVPHALKLVLRGRADYFVYHDIGLEFHIKNNFEKDTFKFAPQPIRQYKHWMVFNKEIPDDVIMQINNALKKMVAKGEIQEILQTYR